MSTDGLASLIGFFLTIVFVWGLARFDYAYYQHTVVLGDSPKRGKFRKWGRVLDILVFRLPAFLLWPAGLIFYYTMMRKYTIAGLSMFEKLTFCGSILSCFLLIGFLVWPAFRSYVMSKLGLVPERYMHRAVVCVMLAILIGVMFVWSFMKEYPTPDYQWMELVFVSLMSTAVVLLALGWGTRRNWREIWIRLGLNKKPTWRGFLTVSLLLLILMGIGQSVGYLVKELEGLWNIQLMQSMDLPRLDWFTILLLGIAPGISEELAFRGALQPRVGLWVSSIVFTLIHMQYDWVGLLFVFLSSLFFGWVAIRYSLWLSIWAHMLMNIIFGVTPWIFT